MTTTPTSPGATATPGPSSPSRPASQVATPSLSRAAWFAEAERRYGGDTKKWRFRCPVCKVATSVQEWKDAGATEGAVAFSCIGRYLPADPHKAFGKHKLKQPCDYAGGGLFKLNPIHVKIENGREHQVFDFADEPLCAPALALAHGAALSTTRTTLAGIGGESEVTP